MTPDPTAWAFTPHHVIEAVLRRVGSHAERRRALAAACLPAAMLTLPGHAPEAWAARALAAADALLAAEDAER